MSIHKNINNRGFNPMDEYQSEIFSNFIESKDAHRKVYAMAVKMYRKNYPGEQIIVYDSDVRDAMCYVVSNKFSTTQNLHNLRLDAATRLYHNIIENVYAEEENYDQFINIAKRVHDTTQAHSVASCKNLIRDKCSYTTGNII